MLDLWILGILIWYSSKDNDYFDDATLEIRIDLH